MANFNEFLDEMEIDLDVLNINQDNANNPRRAIDEGENEDLRLPNNVLDGQQNQDNEPLAIQPVEIQPVEIQAEMVQADMIRDQENEVVRARGTRGNRRRQRQRYRQVSHPYADNRDQMASFIGAIMDAATISRPPPTHYRGRGRGQYAGNAPLRGYQPAYAARARGNAGRGIVAARGNAGVGGYDAARGQPALRGYRAAYAARGNPRQPAAVQPDPANENNLIQF